MYLHQMSHADCIHQSKWQLRMAAVLFILYTMILADSSIGEKIWLNFFVVEKCIINVVVNITNIQKI